MADNANGGCTVIPFPGRKRDGTPRQYVSLAQEECHRGAVQTSLLGLGASLIYTAAGIVFDDELNEVPKR